MKELFVFSFLLVFLMNCEDNDVIGHNSTDCTRVACTEQFVTLMVTVKDHSGVLIPLDAFEVIDTKSLENVAIPLSDSGWQMARENGQYPLYDDSFVSGNLNTNRTLVFKGFINDEKVAEAEFVVATDCCHVSIAMGDTDITIN